MAELSSPISALSAALNDLAQSWNEARGVWDDAVTRRFGTEYVEPIEGQAKATLAAMESLANVIAVARMRLK